MRKVVLGVCCALVAAAVIVLPVAQETAEASGICRVPGICSAVPDCVPIPTSLPAQGAFNLYGGYLAGPYASQCGIESCYIFFYCSCGVKLMAEICE